MRPRRDLPPRGAAGWWLADRALRRIGSALAFAQEGEDRLLERLLEGEPPGIFVDVGAHDPVRFSNTMSLYLRGWRGLSIDPRPGVERRFGRIRRHDRFLAVGVGTEVGDGEYFEFDEPALNTFSPEVARQRLEETSYRLVRRSRMPTRRLDEILRTHLPPGRFDLLTVDVEGRDLDVLLSNDWESFRPRLVCCEELGDIGGEGVENHLARWGYELLGKTMNSRLFRRVD